jgi:hypothetical protein
MKSKYLPLFIDYLQLFLDIEITDECLINKTLNFAQGIIKILMRHRNVKVERMNMEFMVDRYG